MQNSEKTIVKIVEVATVLFSVIFLEILSVIYHSFIHSFTLFSLYPYTGKVPRMWKLSQ